MHNLRMPWSLRALPGGIYGICTPVDLNKDARTITEPEEWPLLIP